MSYLRHWKLSRSPFCIGTMGQGIFAGGTVEEALARSDFLVSQDKRLGLVIGPSGVGKTTFLRHFCKVRSSLQPRERLVRVDLRCADDESVPYRILNGLAPNQDTHLTNQKCWSEIEDHLFASAAIGHRTVLLLDSLSGATDDVYQAISKLWSTPVRWSMLLSLDDDSIVDLPRWILDQSELKIDLPCWDLGQTADYFEFVLQKAGCQDDIFNGQSITRIHELSEGIPRKLAQIADLSLVAGAVRKISKVTSELVDQVCEEFTLPVGGKIPAIWAGQRLNTG